MMTNEKWLPGNKSELLSAIDHEWKLLLDLVESLTDEQMLKPDSGGWSPKDNLAHVAEWVNAFIGYHLERKPAHEVVGTSEELFKVWDLEAINPVLFDRNKDLSRGDIMIMLRSNYERLMAKLDAMSFEDLLKPRYENDPEKRPVLLKVLSYTAEHFQEHRETIEKGIKE